RERFSREDPQYRSNKEKMPPQRVGTGFTSVPTRVQNEIKQWLYQLRWEMIDLPLPNPETQPGHWLIFLDRKGVGQRLVQQLQEQGQRCTLISSGESGRTIDPHRYQVNPANPQEIKQCVQTALAAVQTLPLRGVIHLWSLDTTPVEALNVASLEADQIL